MTQRDQVLTLSRGAGPRGVHTFELRQAYIGNPSQRVRELEDEGYVFEHRRERLHGKATGTRYVLIHEPETAPTHLPSTQPLEPQTGPERASGPSPQSDHLPGPPVSPQTPAGALFAIEDYTAGPGNPLTDRDAA